MNLNDSIPYGKWKTLVNNMHGNDMDNMKR